MASRASSVPLAAVVVVQPVSQELHTRWASSMGALASVASRTFLVPLVVVVVVRPVYLELCTKQTPTEVDSSVSAVSHTF